MKDKHLLPRSVLLLVNFDYSSFPQTHKGGNVGIIANFVFPYIYCFPLYLHQLMLVEM